MKNYECMLGHTNLAVINKVAKLLDNFGVPYEIVKKCEDVTVFCIYYDYICDYCDCEKSQELEEKLEDLAIRYNM